MRDDVEIHVQMSIREAVVEVLYLLTRSDAKIMREELEAMDSFVKENLPEEVGPDGDEAVWDEYRKRIDALAELSWDDRYARFEKDLEFLKAHIPPELQMKLLDQSAKLVVSDGNISHEELAFFNGIGKVWGLDVSGYIKR